jgi:prepilin-type N-terminal cleavage/methylation domain-containing protein
MNRHTARARGFSLIELVIVVVIIGIIAAIAIPRMSRGAQAAADASLQASLRTMRNAIDLFQSEHPTAPNNGFPTLANFVAQLTTYSDDQAATNATKSSQYYLGPYLKEVPALPVGANKGARTLVGTAGGTAGWVYTEATGQIVANASENDARGVAYNTY